MNICIVTRMDYRNYGNRLQNYALKELFQEEGWESISGLTVYSQADWAATSTGLKRIIKEMLPFVVFKKIVKRVIKQEAALKARDLRRKAFVRFTEDYIPVLPAFIVKDHHHLGKLLEDYHFDYYVAGSDQVWNPHFSGRDYEFLTFASREKRLSFAASFGVDHIPDSMVARFSDRLKEMRYISVREVQGVKLAKKLTNREDVDLTLDPTLLLPKEKWEALLQNHTTEKPERYIATYFLGSIPDAVTKFIRQQDLPVLELNSKENEALYNFDPIGFLSVIHDAALVLTDSFHGMAFSIKFHKEFYVYKRSISKMEGDMFSRIEDLLGILCLKDRMQNHSEDILSERIKPIEWESIDNYLLEQKEASFNKLKQFIV